MEMCDLGGFSWEVPEGWRDQSVQVYEEPTPKGAGPANIVVTSRPAQAGEPLQAHVWRRVFETSRMVPSFALLDEGDSEMCGRPAVTVRFRWESPSGLVEQTIVAVESPDARVVTFTLSSFAASAEDGAEESNVDAFGGVLASVVLAPAPGDLAQIGNNPPRNPR